jgi:hypothetical protein
MKVTRPRSIHRTPPGTGWRRRSPEDWAWGLPEWVFTDTTRRRTQLVLLYCTSIITKASRGHSDDDTPARLKFLDLEAGVIRSRI